MPEHFRRPKLAVDIIIKYNNGIVLVKRKNYPRLWAIPGGFVEYGEPLEKAAVREAREETGLSVRLERQFHAYSDPKRDKRFHTVSVVFLAKGSGRLKGGDDALDAKIFRKRFPVLAFDHRRILHDYANGRY